jgi:hypothetical protein
MTDPKEIAARIMRQFKRDGPGLLPLYAATNECEARIAEAISTAQNTWRCFHCGFETADPKEASGHFGDRDDELPLCCSWAELDADGKASEMQQEHAMLLEEQDENIRLRTKIEGIEYQVEGQLSEIHSFAPFRKCSSIREVFHVYDSMEGRALAAEEAISARDAEHRAEIHKLQAGFALAVKGFREDREYCFRANVLNEEVERREIVERDRNELRAAQRELLGALRRLDEDFKYLERTYDNSLYSTGAGYTLQPRVLEIRAVLAKYPESDSNG